MNTPRPLMENIEAEQAVLGSILLDGELIHDCRLEPKQFTRPGHQNIFQAMRKLAEERINIDLVTVVTQLGESVKQIGGVDYLSKLADSVPSTSTIRTYERMVIKAFQQRMRYQLGSRLSMDPTDENAVEIYNQLAELQEVDMAAPRSKREALIEIFEEMNTPRGDITGVDTGLKDFNDMTGGLQGGDLIIVAARPSIGKTAFALNLGMNHSHKGGVSNVFSLEMSDVQLIKRVLSGISRVDGSKWQNPFKRFTPEDHEAIARAIGIFEKWLMNIYDKPAQTVFDIRAAVRKSIKEQPDKQHLVIIDYLQLITPVGKFERHDLAIGHISSELKHMAREFNVPVVLLSQLSRGVESRQDKRPMMSDIRDSGNVEQDADIITFLYRDDYYDKQSEMKNIVEAIIAKQRNGPVGTVELAFLKEYGRFVDLSRQGAMQ
ncbi:replicative DNA helicase [Bacillus tianshenii]|nr:replicative DNA helicase [Bacillus tianshenii]